MAKYRVFGTATPDESQRELEHRSLARRAAAEGMVLLKNEGVLPVSGKRIALFGAGARKTIRGGSGSGDMRERYSVHIEQGLKNAGYEIVSTSWLDRYDCIYTQKHDAWVADVEAKIKKNGYLNFFGMFEVITGNPFLFPVGPEIQSSELTDPGDTAIYVVARMAGEGADRSLQKGDYRLDDVEHANIEKLAAHYDKLLVVINCGGTMDLSFMDTIPGISGLMYFVQGGMEGGNAFADLLSGKITPSGKLTDTWAMKYEDYPAADTYSYLNGDTQQEDYREGIYVGYRYFDSFGVKPRYAFGYGLSYTQFAITAERISVSGTEVKLKVKVENIGKIYSGKEVVQAYLRKPNGRLDHELQSLAAFAKTPLLAPGKSATLDMAFDLRDHSTYDEASAAFTLEAGDYGLFLGNSSDNLSCCAKLVLVEEAIIEETAVCCPKQRHFQDFATPDQRWFAGDVPEHQIVVAEAPVRHEYHDPIPHFDSQVESYLNKLTLKEQIALCVGGSLTGKCYNITPGSVGRTYEKLLHKGIPNVNFSDGPAGLNVFPETVITKDGSQKYVGQVPASYNWGILRKLSPFMMGKPSDGQMCYQYMTAWPVPLLRAQTWDVALLEEIGRAVGREMLEIGVTLWLAPGMNIHRNPLCGRTFEYYSEDPLLSGKLAAAITRGVQSHPGIGVTLKHFACNNQESNRDHVSENVSQRALREIYLKGFRIAIRESDPWSVMSSYNRVNGVYMPNNYDLLTKVLRNEWGYGGLVMSDWNSTGGDKGKFELCPGSGNDMIMPGCGAAKKALFQAVKDGVLTAEQIRRSAGRVLNVVIHSEVFHE